MATHDGLGPDPAISPKVYNDDHALDEKTFTDVGTRDVSPFDNGGPQERLARNLSARQVQMIAIGGSLLYSIHTRRLSLKVS